MGLIMDDSQLVLVAELVSAEVGRLDHEAQMMEARRSRFWKAHAEGLRGQAAHARTALAALEREIDARAATAPEPEPSPEAP